MAPLDILHSLQRAYGVRVSPVHDLPYTQEVWNHVLNWEHFSLPHHVALSNATSLGERLERAEALFPKSHRREFNDIVIYTTWGIWKERNHRMFQHRTARLLVCKRALRACLGSQPYTLFSPHN